MLHMLLGQINDHSVRLVIHDYIYLTSICSVKFACMFWIFFNSNSSMDK